MTDPIADMLTRIRNAQAIRRPEVLLPMSKMKYEIATIMKQEGWLSDVEVIKGGGEKNQAAAFDMLKLVLKYKKSGRPVIQSIRRISKPGLRVYATKETLPRVLNNFGIAILSTSRGIMTNKSARGLGVGGEVLCEIY